MRGNIKRMSLLRVWHGFALCVSILIWCSVVFLIEKENLSGQKQVTATMTTTKFAGIKIKPNDLRDWKTQFVVNNTQFNTKKGSDKFPPVIFYTRISKTGGRSFRSLARLLSVQHNFSVDDRRINLGMNGKHGTSGPIILTPLQNFINFTVYGLRQPGMFTIMRDPVEHFVSKYYFRKYGDSTPVHDKTPKSPVMDINACIQSRHQNCMRNNFFYYGGLLSGSDCLVASPQCVRTAKRNMDEHYFLVGITEEFDNTITILEKILPDYFTGATKLWSIVKDDLEQATTTKVKKELTPESRNILADMLQYDYEIYNYAKERFAKVKKELGID